ncbi:putative two component system response regulator [Streptomyces bottropensis ATCC 25435]|uniref:Putative two component system response regulator n=1 Tax=Streptomyces bottropensis ATCC 25435 TaxID=1054862 RepID=M3F8W1_9ACTN|nr:putative two component system response regulator [Streptomyces bottropensis ATCC 25435]
MLTTFELDEYVFVAIRSGASGFLVKDTERRRTPARGTDGGGGGRAAVAGGDPAADRRVRGPFQAAGGRRLPRRTHRAGGDGPGRHGLTDDEIARPLVVSPLTATTRVSRTMVKLGAPDRAQLAFLAYESGLVRPGWLG